MPEKAKVQTLQENLVHPPSSTTRTPSPLQQPIPKVEASVTRSPDRLNQQPIPKAETSVSKPVIKKKYLTALLRERGVKKLGSTGMTAQISSSGHKIRAPIATLAILVRNKANQAEVHWRIRSGKIDRKWQPIAGRRFDEASGKYVEEALPGWEIRLESIRSTYSNGSPRSVTVSFRKKEKARTQ